MARARDRLQTYRRRRHFDITPEPAPQGPRRPGQARAIFMVHKHDATRLHYDLRLEMDGALASWAIPKGPSYDPAQKRLAVQTEDHPLEYAQFEGRIPEGEYGAGDSIIWDRGTYDSVPPGQASQQRRRGRLLIELAGEKLQGRWHLIRTAGGRGGKEPWLCFKAKDATADPKYDVVAQRPQSVVSGRRVTRGPERKRVLEAVHPSPRALLQRVWPPMKAVLTTPSQVEPGACLFEVKYDGYRAIAALSGGSVALWSRNQLDFGARYPKLRDAIGRLRVAEAVLDGEIVAVDRHGIGRFQRLQESGRAELVLFDLLWMDGEDLRRRPLEERRELLESVLANAGEPLRIAGRVAGTSDEALAMARRRGWEGVIAKRKGSRYAAGRSPDWMKLKVQANQEVAIVGYTPISHGGPEIGALLLAVHEPQGFEYAGKVGTGYTTRMRRELLGLLAPDRVPEPPLASRVRIRDAVWVRPRRVAEVSFSEWTRDGKLRQPVFQGLREDKAPEECVRELPQTLAGRKAPTRQSRRAKPAPAEVHGARRARPKQAARTARLLVEEVPVTHPERVVYPASRITKANVVAYYDDVAPLLIQALRDRPLSFQQWPRGIGGEGIFRQSAGAVPDFVRTAIVQHQSRKLEHILVENPQTVRFLANHSALSLHMPNSRVPNLDLPDWVVFDLDPGEDGWRALVPIAQALRGLLEELGLRSVPKTSGKRGLHVLVPIRKGYRHEQAIRFAEQITGVLGEKFRATATVDRAIARRRGRLYLDAYQNGQLKTVVAPYSLRAIEPAPVSAPLEWDEVHARLDPASLNLKTMAKRLDARGDLFEPALKGGQRLPDLG